MPTYRARVLPGLPPREAPLAPYEFQFDGLKLRIPADHRGPDVSVANVPEQERWIHEHPLRPQATWDCLWTFATADAQQRFIAELIAHGAFLDAPPAVPQARPPSRVAQPRPAHARAPGADCVLEGRRPIDRVEIARVGLTVVCVGLTEGLPRPWDVVARRADDPAAALEALVAGWAPDFVKPIDAPSTHAQALANELDRHELLWVTYRFRGIGGAAVARVLVLPDRVALERLGGKRTLSIFATLDAASAKLGPGDVAAGLTVPTAEELAKIGAQALPKETRKRSKRSTSTDPLDADASLPGRLTAAFRRLTAAGILARERLPGPQSRGWETIATARERGHRGAVFYLAGHWKRREAARSLHVYWVSWEDPAAARALAEEICSILREVGLEVATPDDDTQSIALRVA